MSMVNRWTHKIMNVDCIVDLEWVAKTMLMALKKRLVEMMMPKWYSMNSALVNRWKRLMWLCNFYAIVLCLQFRLCQANRWHPPWIHHHHHHHHAVVDLSMLMMKKTSGIQCHYCHGGGGDDGEAIRAPIHDTERKTKENADVNG